MASDVWRGACLDRHRELRTGEGQHVGHAAVCVCVGKAVESGQDVFVGGGFVRWDVDAPIDRVDAHVDVLAVLVHGRRMLHGIFDLVHGEACHADLPIGADAAQLDHCRLGQL